MGQVLFPSNGELGPGLIAARLGKRILARGGDAELSARVARLVDDRATLSGLASLAERPPHFCSGCPHNSSTKVPEGSRAFAGIGCHGLVLPMERSTSSYTHMRSEEHTSELQSLMRNSYAVF